MSAAPEATAIQASWKAVEPEAQAFSTLTIGNPRKPSGARFDPARDHFLARDAAGDSVGEVDRVHTVGGEIGIGEGVRHRLGREALEVPLRLLGKAGHSNPGHVDGPHLMWQRSSSVNVGLLLSKAALAHGARPALAFGDRRWTYAELDEWTGRLAGGLLTLGLQRGDRVVLWMRNRPELAALMLGCWKAGLCTVPANFRLHPSEVAYLVDNSRAAALFCDETFSPPPPAPGVRVLSALELPSGTPL